MNFPHSENQEHMLTINNNGLSGDDVKSLLKSVAGDMGFEYQALVGIVELYKEIDDPKVDNLLLSFNFGRIKPTENYTSLEFQVLSGVQKMHPVDFSDDSGREYSQHLENLIDRFKKRIDNYSNDQKDIDAVTEKQ